MEHSTIKTMKNVNLLMFFISTFTLIFCFAVNLPLWIKAVNALSMFMNGTSFLIKGSQLKKEIEDN